VNVVKEIKREISCYLNVCDPKAVKDSHIILLILPFVYIFSLERGAFDSAKNHKRQRRKRQSVTAKREKSQTPKFV